MENKEVITDQYGFTKREGKFWLESSFSPWQSRHITHNRGCEPLPGQNTTREPTEYRVQGMDMATM
uniref:Uncharacterized protein n=1 Tax=Rhizophora mucronata TaxID=61149 RepID=A0A2P2KEN4_RHIMU